MPDRKFAWFQGAAYRIAPPEAMVLNYPKKPTLVYERYRVAYSTAVYGGVRRTDAPP
jgi:hypothetical protein